MSSNRALNNIGLASIPSSSLLKTTSLQNLYLHLNELFSDDDESVSDLGNNPAIGLSGAILINSFTGLSKLVTLFV